MIAQDIFLIPGRGYVVTTEYDGPRWEDPQPGIELRQLPKVSIQPALSWKITGIERFVQFLGRPMITGEKVGFLLSENESCLPVIGQEIFIVF